MDLVSYQSCYYNNKRCRNKYRNGFLPIPFIPRRICTHVLKYRFSWRICTQVKILFEKSHKFSKRTCTQIFMHLMHADIDSSNTYVLHVELILICSKVLFTISSSCLLIKKKQIIINRNYIYLSLYCSILNLQINFSNDYCQF